MSREELTESEQELLAVMKAADEPDAEPAKEEPGVTTEPTEGANEASSEVAKDPDAKEPEFKSSRTDDKPPEGYVPHQAMHAERTRRQELERRLEALEAAQAPKEEEPAPEWADPVIDPEAHRKWQEHQNAQMQARLDAIEANTKEQGEVRQRFETAERLEREFMAENPDYGAAVQHLHASRVAELRGQGMADAEISAQISKDANALFDAAQMIGMNPAQLLYQRAHQAGYTKEEQPAQTDDGDKIVALAEAQKNTQGLSSAGGGEQKGKLTASQLAEMSEEEMAKLSPEQIRAAMGG